MFLQPNIKRRDMINCALCDNAPCDEACPYKLNPGEKLREIWLGGEHHAVSFLPETDDCAVCDALCEKVCVRPGLVPIKGLITRLRNEVKPVITKEQLADESILQTDICGIPLENPFLLCCRQQL